MSTRIGLPYTYFPDPTRGRPVYFGAVYLGEADKDPELFPVQAYIAQENGPIIPVAQPLETGAGGVILYNGSPATVLVDGTSYSMRVRDNVGGEVYYIPNSFYSDSGGAGGGGSGDFVERAGDNMFGNLEMYNESKTIWYSDQGLTPRAEVFTSNVELEGERSGIRLFDQFGNDGNQPGLGQELISLRTEFGTDDILRSALVVQRNEGTQSSSLDYSGIIGFNNIREDTDDAVFFIQGEQAPFLSWFGTAWDQAEGLNSTQLRICRPAADTTVDYISLCNVVDGTPFFTVDPDGNVNIAAGSNYFIDGVPVGGGGGGGVPEAPIDGNTYGRRDAAWVDISGVIAGDFLPYDGSLPFTGTVGDLVIQNETKFIFTDDVAGSVKRMETIAYNSGPLGNARAGLRIFDVDGNAGEGPASNDNQELVSLRAQQNATTLENEAALVLQNNVGTSTSANGFNGIIGFNNIEDNENYAQFIIQGTTAAFPDGRDRRRAWFGTQWPSGPSPTSDGMESIQLYINRTSNAATSGMIDLRVADEQKFTVTDLGRVDAAGVVRAQGLSGGFSTGFGVELYSDLNTKEGIIRCYDADLAEYGKLFVAGDTLDFRTTTNAGQVVSNFKIWQNPASVTEDEVAIFNKAQLRQYADSSGTQIACEFVGSGTSAYGQRIYQPGTASFGINLESAVGGVSSVLMRKPGGTGSDYGISLITGSSNNSEIVCDGPISSTGGTSTFQGIVMTGTNAGIDMQNAHRVFNHPDPTSASSSNVAPAGWVNNNYVGLASTQTVSGAKTFSNTQNKMNGLQMYASNGINMNFNNCFNLPTPTASNHAATKGWVEGGVSINNLVMSGNPNVGGIGTSTSKFIIAYSGSTMYRGPVVTLASEAQAMMTTLLGALANAGVNLAPADLAAVNASVSQLSAT